MFIPDINQKVDIKDQKISVLVYGQPMVGKTYFSKSAPNPLFFNTDGNTQDIESGVIDLRNEQEITLTIKGEVKTGKASKWNLLKGYVHQFSDEKFVEQIKSAGYETIVIDVLDHTFDWCREAVLASRGLENESDDSRAYSPIYSEIKREFRSVIVKLIEAIKSNFNLVMVSFEATEEYQEGLDKKLRRVPSFKKKMENSSGEDKDKIYEAITSRINVITGIFIVNYSSDDGVKEMRVAYPYSSKDWIGGNRLGITQPIIPTFEQLTKSTIKEKE